jgi:hypothetical protein
MERTIDNELSRWKQGKNERNLEEGLRISGENFTTYDKIKTIPLYAVKNILHTSV